MMLFLCYLLIYCVEGSVAWYYFDQLFQTKHKPLFTVGCVSMGYCLLFLINFFHAPLLNALAFVAINCLLLLFCYFVNLKQAFLHALLLTSFMIITEMAWGIFLFRSYHTLVSVSFVATLSIPSKLLYLLVCIFVCRFFRCKTSIEVKSNAAFLILCILPIASIVLSYVVFRVGFGSELKQPANTLVFTLVYALVAVNLLFLVVYHVVQTFYKQQTELLLNLQKEKSDVAYYQALQKQTESHQIAIHDIKNHLQTIYGIASRTQNTVVCEYIQTLTQNIANTPTAQFCKNSVLNFILLNAQEQCIEKNIDFSCKICENRLDFMDSASITTLYSNLLSNAIQAAETSKQKYIEFCITERTEQNQIIVSVVNSCDTPPISDRKGGFVSLKKDQPLSGIGLKSIQRIVKKYNGDSLAYFDKNSNSFHHIINFFLSVQHLS